ncbi:hypothetical protein H5410_026412, partial [Solanum commersonii]
MSRYSPPMNFQQGQNKGQSQGGTSKTWIPKDTYVDKQKEGEVIPGLNKAAKGTSHELHESNGDKIQDQQVRGRNLHSGKPIHNNPSQIDYTNNEAHLHPNVSIQTNNEKDSQSELRNKANQHAASEQCATNIIVQGTQNQQNNQQPMHSQNNVKKDLVPEPSPYTIVQSFAARLRQNQAKNDTLIELSDPIDTSRQGLPAVIFDKDDFMIKLAARHVYIDLDNELDYIIEFFTALLTSIGKVLYLDTSSIQKTRGSIAKVKKQVDLTKERPPHVWMGFGKGDHNVGRWQAIQYESVPDYCSYCKHQRRLIHVCTIEKRDEEYKKRMEMEAEKKTKNKENKRKQLQAHSYNNNYPRKLKISQQKISGKPKRKRATNKPKTAWTDPTHLKTRCRRISNTRMQHTQDQSNSHEEKENQSSKYIATLETQVAPEKVTKSNPTLPQKFNNIQMDEKMLDHGKQRKKTTGIDSMFPSPSTPIVNCVYDVDEAKGGMEGGCREKPTNLQEGVSKGGNLTHVLHEVSHIDPRNDYSSLYQSKCSEKSQPSADTGQIQDNSGYNATEGNGVSMQQTQKINNSNLEGNITPSDRQKTGGFQRCADEQKHQNNSVNTEKTTNNKSQGKLSKKKRDSIKRKQQKEAEKQGTTSQVKENARDHSQQQNDDRSNLNSEYDAIQSEDEFDEDTQSLNEDEDGDETSAHLIKAFGSIFQSDFQEEIQATTDQQGLSPRGRKQTRSHTRQASMSPSATSSRPNTRSRSK